MSKGVKAAGDLPRRTGHKKQSSVIFVEASSVGCLLWATNVSGALSKNPERLEKPERLSEATNGKIYYCARKVHRESVE